MHISFIFGQSLLQATIYIALAVISNFFLASLRVLLILEVDRVRGKLCRPRHALRSIVR